MRSLRAERITAITMLCVIVIFWAAVAAVCAASLSAPGQYASPAVLRERNICPKTDIQVAERGPSGASTLPRGRKGAVVDSFSKS